MDPSEPRARRAVGAAIAAFVTIGIGVAMTNDSETQAVSVLPADDAGVDAPTPDGATRGIRIGDPTSETGDTSGWFDSDGSPNFDIMPELVPICDPAMRCETVVGFVRAREFFATRAPLSTETDPNDPSLQRSDDGQLIAGPAPTLDVLDEAGRAIGTVTLRLSGFDFTMFEDPRAPRGR